MSQKKPAQKNYIVTIRAEVIEEAEETYSISATSNTEAIKEALDKFDSDYNAVESNSIEIEVQRNE